MRKYVILALVGIGIGCGCYLSVSAMQQTSKIESSSLKEVSVEPVVIETTKATVESQLSLENNEEIVKNSEKIVKLYL